MNNNILIDVKCIKPTKSLKRNRIYKAKIGECFCGNHAGFHAYREYYLIEFSTGRFVNVSPKRFKKI